MDQVQSVVRSILSGVGRFISSGRALPAVPARLNVSAFAVLVLDKSGSMAGVDWAPSRLAAAKDAAARFVCDRSTANREAQVGIVAFDNMATIVYPVGTVFPTDACLTAIETLNAGGGTDAHAGLEEAVSDLTRVCRISLQNCEIVLLTDGHSSHEPEALALAQHAKDRGCVIHAVGIGGSPEAVNEAFLRELVSRDAEGRPLYRFISNSAGLVRHFGDLGGGITR